MSNFWAEPLRIKLPPRAACRRVGLTPKQAAAYLKRRQGWWTVDIARGLGVSSPRVCRLVHQAEANLTRRGIPLLEQQPRTKRISDSDFITLSGAEGWHFAKANGTRASQLF